MWQQGEGRGLCSSRGREEAYATAEEGERLMQQQGEERGLCNSRGRVKAYATAGGEGGSGCIPSISKARQIRKRKQDQ